MKCLLSIYDGRNEFWQWDTNQKLKVEDPTITQVHFSNKGMTHSLVTDVYEEVDGTRVCSVPDIILQLDRTLIAYAYLRDKELGETLYSVKFHVVGREIPSDYVANQDAEIDKLDDRISALEEKVGDQTVVSRIDALRQELQDGAPENLNTINKVANAIGNDPQFHKTINDKVDTKVDKVEGKELSENDFTDYYKNRVDQSLQYSEVDQTFNPASDHPQSGKALNPKFNEKVDKIPGKELSENDFTDDLKLKLDNIQPGATNVIIDPTLKIKGQAADAKKVGDALDQKQPVGDYIYQKEIYEWARQPKKPSYTYEEVGADQVGTAQKLVSEHNVAVDAHNDIRLHLKKIDEILSSPDVDLDTLAEIIKYIKDNRDIIDQITTDKVNVADIVNNLTTNVANVPLSAAMGVEIKRLIDDLDSSDPNNKVVYQPDAPSNLSQLWVDIDDDTADGFVVPIDETLTKVAWAADAKAAGDKIEEVRKEIPLIDKTLSEPDQTADAKAVGDALANKQEVGDYLVRSDLADWAKQPTKPKYNYEEVGADGAGTAVAEIKKHDVSELAHADIRKLISDLNDHINTILNSEDVDLDQLSEIVAYIKNNKDLIEQITTDKVSVSDIINDLTHSQETKKPLSAKMGYELKGLIDEVELHMPDNKVVVNDVEPENKTSLWVDTNDNSTGDIHVNLDDTLTKVGCAAEARTVGDLIRDLTNRIEILERK